MKLSKYQYLFKYIKIINFENITKATKNESFIHHYGLNPDRSILEGKRNRVP